jgi:hypothetical protein
MGCVRPALRKRREAPQLRWERPMTVCIAAICTWPEGGLMIVGASDRMLSAPDIKFEPPQKKLYGFHDNAIALVAGDPYTQIAICDETSRAMALKPRGTIKELAALYADAFSAHRRRIAEAKYLKPLGLDANSFMDRSPDFRSDLVSDLRLDLQREPLDAEAIIAGFDDTGPHLFVVADPGVVSCADSIAFASIGTGKSHADSYFMMAHHTRQTPSHKALLDTYVAKRRSEVSPTVGSATDLFYIGARGFQDVADGIKRELEQIYQALEHKIATASGAAAQAATKAINEYVEKQQEEERRATEAPPMVPAAKVRAKKAAPKRRKQRPPESPSGDGATSP